MIQRDNFKAWTTRTAVFVGPEMGYNGIAAPRHGQIIRAIPSDRVDASATHSVAFYGTPDSIEIDNIDLEFIDTTTQMSDANMINQFITLFMNGKIDTLVFAQDYYPDHFGMIYHTPASYNINRWHYESRHIDDPCDWFIQQPLTNKAEMVTKFYREYNGPIDRLLW